MSSRQKALLAGAALMVTVIAFAAGMLVILRDAPRHRPEITAYADRKAVRVPACDTETTDCTRMRSTELPVAPGSVLQLSLPAELARGLWVLQPLYTDRNQEEPDPLPPPVVYEKGTSAVTWPTQHAGPRLAGIEIQQPVVVNGQLRLQRVWSIKTL